MEPDHPWPKGHPARAEGGTPMDAAWWRMMRIKTGALRMPECEYVEMSPMPNWLARIIEDLGRITCGNAILSGTLPEIEHQVIESM